MTPTPIPDSYWMDPGRLLAGEYPGAWDRDQAKQKLDSFVRAGVRTFVDLTESRELQPYQPLLKTISGERQLELRYERFSIRDGGIPLPDEMRRILAHIRAELAEGRAVYVHCWGGIGRTGTVVGCWLVEQGRSAQAALEEVETLRAKVPDARFPSPENEQQREFVRGWQRGLPA